MIIDMLSLCGLQPITLQQLLITIRRCYITSTTLNTMEYRVEISGGTAIFLCRYRFFKLLFMCYYDLHWSFVSNPLKKLMSICTF